MRWQCVTPADKLRIQVRSICHKRINSKPEYMKKYLLPAVAVLAVHGLSAQIENGNFDHWTSMEMFDHPTMAVPTSSSNYETFLETGEVNVTPVQGITGTAMRLESISQGERVFPGFFITGNVPQGDSEEMVFTGGMPTTDKTVNGVSMDIRYDVSAESPGFVVVQFKRGGIPIGQGNLGTGTMIHHLSGASEWTNISIVFQGGFDQTPDECVVGIATANLLGDDEPFPAGSFVEIDNLNFSNSAELFFGGDFENWNSVESLHSPEGVLVEMDPFAPTFERTTDAHTGMFALKIFNAGHSENVKTGRAIFAEGEFENPQPYITLSSDMTSLNFMYKYEASNDVAGADVVFYHSNGEGELSPVHFKHLTLAPAAEYSAVDYNFAEELSAEGIEASHMMITFEASTASPDNAPKLGSTLFIDNVALNGSLWTFGVKVTQPKVVAMPNPAVDRVVFTFPVARSGFYRVFNSRGVQVDIKQFQHQHQIVHDLRGLRTGAYLFRFQHESGIDVVRVINL